MAPKTEDEIEAMRYGGKALAAILSDLAREVKPGVSTQALAEYVAAGLKTHGVQSAILGYEGFPSVLCVSVNEEVVHGIPSKNKIIRAGDVVSLDLGVSYKGLIVDGACSVFVGQRPSADTARLINGTREALAAGIQAIRGEGTPVGDVSQAIAKVLNRCKLGIVRDLVGHAVGHGIHEDPNIPNYGAAGTGPRLTAGMTVAIEPMATLGDWHVNILPDGWTVVTRDGTLAAHFEHTVLITKTGAEILTTL